MIQKNIHSYKSFLFGMMFIVAMAFSMTACGDNNKEKPNTESSPNGMEQNSEIQDVQETDRDVTKETVLGEGETVFDFVVVDRNGKESTYEIHTDKETVGEALMEVGLLEGEEGPYGLYVKSVAGTTLDYNKDGMYWSFYIGEEYAMTGVDVTPITEGETYSFKAEKS